MGADSGLTRREILMYGAAGSALLAAGVIPQAGSLAARSPSGPTDFEEATVAELRAALRSATSAPPS